MGWFLSGLLLGVILCIVIGTAWIIKVFLVDDKK